MNIYHVIKDPVHGTMQFNTTEDSWVKPFIDSRAFQRLRHIKQLGLGDYIFPGAVHTRFNHSLGCCYIASQIAEKIGLSDAEKQLVMIACLMHDIGHGPFSHAFEGIFEKKMIRHEDWTPYFLNAYNTAHFFNEYNKKNVSFPLSEEKFSEISQMIMHQRTQKPVLADIVSSQLDADRLDYLLRDSHFCGVRYGEYDLAWMMHCLQIIATKEGERLGITHKGIGVVEHYLMARRLMTRNIYHSQKKLALEHLLIEFLANLARGLNDYQPYQELRKSPLGQFLLAVNQFNENNASKKDFLQMHFLQYQDLCDYDVFYVINYLAHLMDNHPATELAQVLTKRKMPKIIRFDEDKEDFLKTEVLNFKQQYQVQFKDWQIKLITTPAKAYSKEEPILVQFENNQIKPINEASLLLNAISDQMERMVFLSIDEKIINNDRIVKLIDYLQQKNISKD